MASSSAPPRASSVGAIRLLLLGAIVVSAVLLLRQTPWLRDADLRSIPEIRGLFRGIPYAELAFVVGFAVAGLAVPAAVLTIAGGLLFGFGLGALLSWTGAMVGALGAYGLARGVAGRVVSRWLGARVSRLDRAAKRHPFRTILTLRLLPVVPFSVLNLAAGVARVRFRDYVLASAVGLAPMTLMLSYFAGTMFRGSAEAKAEIWWRLATLCVLLLAFSLAPAAANRWVARARTIEARDSLGGLG
ncbi:MAG: VTT domain-containing protein [Gemmatimonadota bacterium]|nr:VTT domain-containing protein [Gemmatimonadota bacterium]